jgi:hypothetical protein
VKRALVLVEYMRHDIEKENMHRGIESQAGTIVRTHRELYAEAKHRGIDGRSKMSEAGLEKALG